MKKSIVVIVVICCFFKVNSQNNQLETLTVGFGFTNTIMHGDLTSLNSIDNQGLNLGFYVNITKMISPAFGFELKGQILSIEGASQDFTSSFPVLFTDNTVDNLNFESDTFGGELNAVLNLNGLSKNPYASLNRKINFSAYLGLGYHTYSAKLFNPDTNELLIDFSNVPGRDRKKASSIYYSSGLGVRYKLSSRLDLELRQNIHFNNEDHLDAAISSKQTFETFFTTNLGLVVKLNSKATESVVWQDEIIEEVVDKDSFKDKESDCDLNDSDGDGVIDQLDQEKNTPKGAITYGNGVAIDSDKDGIIDLIDKCPLKFGSRDFAGCPVEKDTDKDGVKDSEDLCPNVVGPVDNQGCPIALNTITEIEKTKIVSLAKNIYFESGKAFLSDSSKRDLESIAGIMTNYIGIDYRIEGHTDSGGQQIYNLRLSQRRADEVKRYLIQKGVSADNLKAKGFGFSVPLYKNTTSDGRQLNRRVEIKIFDSSQIIESTSQVFKEVSSSYTVQEGDTLFSLSKKFNITVDQLKQWNNLTTNNIIVGSILIIKL